ncbi:hypothetical protein ILUMI_13342 [Ignelater luminosus]|uniref:Integrase catalytic domain-containing protein n=1 Tax=Ignelater luminosus TaxID=2038154 RepID=A0A8K0CXZ0_IGNLU|nr:hypothetical protein ILUMI_13342 [Ignelater luminosus]
MPLTNISAETIAELFYNNWISRYGTPCKLITDRGSQFTAETFQVLSKICGIKLQHTTAYHPQSNGKIERLYRTLKTTQKAHNNVSWSETLPTVLLGLRTVIQENHNHSIAEMVYGQNIRLPGEFVCEPSIRTISESCFIQNLRNHMENIRPKKNRQITSQPIFVHKDLKTTSDVFLRIDRVKKQLEPPYQGPLEVIERNEKYFISKIKGKEINVLTDRLKPAYILPENKTLKSTNDNSNKIETQIKGQTLITK